MKYLIILLFSFSAIASYMDKNNVGNCENGIVVYAKKKQNTIKIPKDYNCYYHFLQPKTQVKAETESCVDDLDCQTKLENKTCENGYAIKNIDLMEVYCTWVRPDHIRENASLKAQYEAEQSVIAQEKQSKATKESERETTLKQCARVALKDIPDLDPGSLTQAQLANQLANRQNKIKDCLAVLLREVISEKLDLSDL